MVNTRIFPMKRSGFLYSRVIAPIHLNKIVTRAFALALIAVALCTLCLCTFAPAPAVAGWQQMTKPVAYNRQVHSAFFFNELNGFVGLTGVEGIYRTGDGGLSWTRCNFPNGYAGDITDIFMRDALNGWSTIEEPGGKRFRMFRTNDGGITWSGYGPVGDASCVYQTSKAVVVTSRSITGSGAISTDNGTTFQLGSLVETNGIDFVDDLHGVVTGFDVSPWLRSIDGGQTWQKIVPNLVAEMWSVYGVKGTNIFYAAGEGDLLKPKPSAVLRSNDYGATWVNVGTVPVRTTGHVAGVGETLYVQAEDDPSINSPASFGMYRSTNQGKNWVNVGGPSNGRDVRFAVTGCGGGVVYAFDEAGNVWKTRDGGDGKLPEPPLMPVIGPNPLAVNAPLCTPKTFTLTFENHYCSDIKLLQVGFTDSAHTFVSSGALKIGREPAIPTSYATNEGDSITIVWDPNKILHTDSSGVLKLHLRFYSSFLLMTFDTIITLNVHGIGGSPAVAVSPTLFKVDTVHPCTKLDSLLTITNNGCDTLYVTGAGAATLKGFTLLDSNKNPVKFPYAVAPGQSLKFDVLLKPLVAGLYQSNILLHLKHQGINKDTTLRAQTYVPFENAYAIPSAINMDTITTCRSLDSIIALLNPSCDTLKIISIALKSGLNFSLQGVGVFPKFVLGDSTFPIRLRFSPSAVVPYLDSLIITIFALETTKRIAIPIRGMGATGTSSFAMSLSKPSIDFSTRTRCDPPDSAVFVIVNPGCNGMDVRSAVLEGITAPAVTLGVTPALPVTIKDGDTVRLVVKFTHKQAGLFTGDIHVRYRFGVGVTTDTLIQFAGTVVHGSQLLSVDSSIRKMGVITFCSTKDTQIIYKNLGCDTLTISGRTLSGASFLLLNPKKTPYAIPPGGSDTVLVRYVPVVSGLSAGVVTLNSDADSIPQVNISLLAAATPTDTLHFFAKASRDSAVAGDTVLILIIPDRTVKNRGLQSIHFVLNYNGDILTPITGNSLIPGSSLTISPEIRSQQKTAYLPAMISGTDLPLDSLKPIAQIGFRTTLSDSSWTPLSFSDLTLNSGSAQYAKCILGATSISTNFQLQLLCGDSTIKLGMEFGKNLPLTALPAYPNPVLATENTEFIIPYSLRTTADIELAVYDKEGKLLKSYEHTAEKLGEHNFVVPSGTFGSGAYYYTLRLHGTSVARFGSFVILR
jgi:photosystem II stability/assembly factor-like uncharacterized protein